MRGGLRVSDGIGPILDLMAVSGAAQVLEAMDQGKYAVETHARYNAPWADRTGMARSGLTAEVYHEGGEIVLELYHTVDYGQWLELIQSGRFAVIMPTLELMGPQVIRDAGGALLRVGGAFE